jgi:ActR/RegA family two-component response regulator
MFGQRMSMKMKHQRVPKKRRTRNIVLIVDDYWSLARTLERHIKPLVDEVYIASSAWEAQYILNSVLVTHLLCDLNINAEEDGSLRSAVSLPSIDNHENKPGFELASGWRREHQSIQKVVIYTGEDTKELSKPDDVDALICKTDIDSVIDALLGGVISECSSQPHE